MKREPNNADAHFTLGVALRHANYKHFGRLGLGTTYDPTIMYRPDAVQMRESVSELRKAVRLRPNNAWSRYFLGKDLADIGLIHAAVAEYRRALSLTPGKPPSIIKDPTNFDSPFYDSYANGAYNDLGDALQKLRRYPEAVRQYQKDLALLPDDDYALLHIGIALNHGGHRTQALSYWRHLDQIRGGDGLYAKQAHSLMKKYYVDDY